MVVRFTPKLFLCFFNAIPCLILLVVFSKLCNKLSFVSVTDKFFKLTVGGNAREEDDDSAANDADQ